MFSGCGYNYRQDTEVIAIVAGQPFEADSPWRESRAGKPDLHESNVFSILWRGRLNGAGVTADIGKTHDCGPSVCFFCFVHCGFERGPRGSLLTVQGVLLSDVEPDVRCGVWLLVFR